jgi:hypothetical protein
MSICSQKKVELANLLRAIRRKSAGNGSTALVSAASTTSCSEVHSELATAINAGLGAA